MLSARHVPVPISHSTGTTAAAEAISTGATEEWDSAHLGFTLIVTNRKTATAEKMLTVSVMSVVCFYFGAVWQASLGVSI